jgi:peptide/nickel transport system substrate-binding protein
MKSIQSLKLIITTLVLVLAATACGPTPEVPTAVPPTPTGEESPGAEMSALEGGKLIYGLTLAPSGIDPHVNASSELGIPLTSVYDTLVWQDLSGEFVPGLAKSWQISDDGLTYTFHLREDVVFHDGTPFDAQAVKFNLDRIADPATKSQKAIFMLGPYESTEIVDDYTVKVHLKEPYAPFLDSASQVYLGMASPTAIEKWGADYQLHQVGTGPFILKEYIPQDHLTLVRNPDYNWAPPIFNHQGPAYLEEIEFRFFVEPATRALALEGGEADVMGEIPPHDAERLADNPAFTLLPVAIPGQSLQFFLNTEKAPTDDLQVRQAINYATDKAAIVKAIFKEYSPVAHGPLNAFTIGYDESVDGMYGVDPAKAERLLEEAGWVDSDGDGNREKDGQLLKLEAYLMGWGYVPEVAQLLQAQLKAVGIEMKSQVVAYPAALEAAREGKHNLIPFGLSSSDPDILRTFFHSSNADSGFNWSKVRDPRLDELLENGAHTLDLDKRKELYAEAQQLVMAEALILPIRDYVNLNAASARVKGLRYDLRGWFPWLYDVYLEQ